MNVKKLRLVNFKRFADLTVDLSSLEKAPKLILLIGANGTGKSSLFDAFEYLSGPLKGDYGNYLEYTKKDRTVDTTVSCSLGGGFEITRSNASQAVTAPGSWNAVSAFYGRSSFRTIPELRDSRRGAMDIADDGDRPRRYIDHDTRFETDISQMTRRVLEEVWGPKFDSDTLKARFVDPINDALARIFANGSATNLRLTQMYPALEGNPPDIRFRKGDFEVHYDLLSSGEKEVFNILLNLFVRREHFTNAVYFIDELDVHLHTRLQYALIKEVVERWIPEYSQLWTASHSLGFIDYANDAAEAEIVDFDDLNFDQPQVLGPSPKSAHIFDIAVPRDSVLRVFPNRQLVLCENKDASLYNAIALPKFLFVGARDKNAVRLQSMANEEFFGLIDRDFLGSEEILAIRRMQPNLFVLGYYCMENYLYHPDNLVGMPQPEFDEAQYRELVREKMKTSRDLLLRNSERSRGGHEVIKTFSKEKKSEAMDEVTAATASGDFETFYPFLDMKSNRPGAYLGPLNFNPKDLAQTAWMREAIAMAMEVSSPRIDRIADSEGTGDTTAM